VIFDSQLVVKHAFDGMVHHDLTCAPVWDSWKKKYVGLLSVSDFLDILSTDTQTANQPARTMQPGEGTVRHARTPRGFSRGDNQTSLSS